MCLEAKCQRCQGIFRNFQQIVCRDAESYCVQCDQAIRAGAPARMYPAELQPNSIFEASSEPQRGAAA